MKKMDYDDLCFFMLLYISKNTFTPTLCNSQDIYVREVSITTYEGRISDIKVTYPRSQS